MRANEGTREAGGRGRMQQVLPVLTIAIGAVLLAYMVTVESEPGAIPLLLIVGGIVWLFAARRRSGRA